MAIAYADWRPPEVNSKETIYSRDANQMISSTYHCKVEKVIVDSVIMYHYQARVQTQANENKRNKLEHPYDAQHHGSLLAERQEIGHSREVLDQLEFAFVRRLMCWLNCQWSVDLRGSHVLLHPLSRYT